MIVRINKEVFSNFNPKLKVAVIKADNLDNHVKLNESIHMLKEVEQMTRMTFHKTKVKDHSLIEPWRVAQEEFGKKARHYHTSVEQLLRTVLANKSVATKDVLTNLTRYLSLKYVVPFGLDDANKITGDLTFSLSTGREKAGILKSLKKGELYYTDDKDVLGTKLDYWKSAKTALTPYSFSAIIHLEVLPPVKSKELNQIVKETRDLIVSFCEADVKTAILHKEKDFVKI